MPIVREKFVATAHTRGADAIILDLEDSVPEAEKDRARGLVPAAAKEVSKGGADVLVRINRPWHQAFRDIEAAVGPGVMALMCPKVESPEHLGVIAELLDTFEAARGLPVGHTRLVALVETADAYFRVREIAKATPRLVAMSLGAEDFALSVGMEPIGETLQAPEADGHHRRPRRRHHPAGLHGHGRRLQGPRSSSVRSCAARASSASSRRAAFTRAWCTCSTRSTASLPRPSTERSA